ncbi:MAG: gliding motility-associated C-terminal domain-containing protein, partial [Flavobacteriales bacterium]|nr:gliding motility-associated C-terminal domain-containing protein [Flavobacteriales bacterium]
GQFIAKLDPSLNTLLIGSRFGVGDGTLDISPTAFLVDYCDKLYVCGWGSSGGSLGTTLSTTGMTTTPGAVQIGTDGNDFYLAVFEVDMSNLSYATFFGGGSSQEHVDGGTSRFDRRGRVYGAICAGCGGNDDLPTTPGAWSNINGNSCNLGVFKFDFDAPLVIAQPVAIGPVCANAPVQFLNYSQLGAGFVWDFGDGSDPSNAVVPTHQYAEPGTYTVTLTATNPNACNGSDVDSIQVVVQPQAPQLEAMADVSICGPAAQLILSANGFGTADHFVWSSNGSFSDTLNLDPSDSTALLAPIVGGTYYVQASTPGSCIAVDQVQVSASLQNIAITPDSAICLAETATLGLTGVDPGSTIVWGPEGSGIINGQGSPTLLVQPSASQEYTVQVTSPTGCVWNGSATISVSDIPAALVSATVDQPIVAPGTTVQLSAQPTDGYSFMWTPANTVSNASIAAPTAFVAQSTTFIVSISDGICTRDASVSVEVRELNCGEPDIYVPDAFTPNGDGNNDVLFVRGRWITAFEFKLFDRWGSLVFETTDQRAGWDGSYKGEPVDPAVFVYWLEATCADGQTYFTKGNVTVIR